MEIKAQLNSPYTDIQRADFIVEYNHKLGYLIEETEDALLALGYTEEEKTQQRQDLFESEFLSTSLGNYRLTPKGYANAQQSMDTIHNLVLIAGGLTEQIAQRIVFYDTPDFADETQCTEEWLVAHQHNPKTMTTEEWGQFYLEFSQLYNQKQHTNSI